VDAKGLKLKTIKVEKKLKEALSRLKAISIETPSLARDRKEKRAGKSK